MLNRLFVIIFSIVFLAGCATAGKKQEAQLQDLQSRVNVLEEELARKDQQIKAYETQLGVGGQKLSDLQGDISGVKLSKTQVQEALKNAGIYQGPIDGKIGQKTEAAIVEFQKANSLKADGKVGKMTSAALKKYLKE